MTKITKKNNATVFSKWRRRSFIGMRRHAQTIKDILQFRKMELSILLTPVTQFTSSSKNLIELKPNTRRVTHSYANANLNEKYTKSRNRGNKRPSKQENFSNKIKRVVYEDYDETTSHDSSNSEEDSTEVRPFPSTSKIETNKCKKLYDRILQFGKQFNISKASLSLLKDDNFIFGEIRIQLVRLPESLLNTSRKDAKPAKTDVQSVEKDAEPIEQVVKLTEKDAEPIDRYVQPNEEVVEPVEKDDEPAEQENTLTNSTLCNKRNDLGTSSCNTSHIRECRVVLHKLSDVVPRAIQNVNISDEKLDNDVQDSDSSSNITESLFIDLPSKDAVSESLTSDLSKINPMTSKIVIEKVSVPPDSGISVPVVSKSLNVVADVTQNEKSIPSPSSNSSAPATTCTSATISSSDSTSLPNVEKSLVDSANDLKKLILKISRNPLSQKYTSSIAEQSSLSSKTTAPKLTPNCDIRSNVNQSGSQPNKSVSSSVQPSTLPLEKTTIPENQQSPKSYPPNFQCTPSSPQNKKTTCTQSTQTSPSHFDHITSSTFETIQRKSVEDATCSVVEIFEPSFAKSKHDVDNHPTKKKDRKHKKEKKRSHRSRSSDHSSNRERSGYSSGRSAKESSHRDQNKERSTSSRYRSLERLSNEKKDSHPSNSHRSLSKEKNASRHHTSDSSVTRDNISNRHHSSERSASSHRHHSSDRSSSRHLGSHSRSKSVPESINEQFSSVSELLAVLIGNEDDENSASSTDSLVPQIPEFFSTTKTYSAVLSTVKDASSNSLQSLQNSTTVPVTSSSSKNVLPSTTRSTHTSSTSSKATNVSVLSSSNSASVKSSFSFTDKHVSTFYPELLTISAGKNTHNRSYVAAPPRPHNVPFYRSSVTNAVPSSTSDAKMPHTSVIHSLPVTPLNMPTAKPPQMSTIHFEPINSSYVPNFNNSTFKPVYVNVKLPQTSGSQPIIQRVYSRQNTLYQPTPQPQIRPTMPPKPYTFVKPAPLPITRTPTKNGPQWQTFNAPHSTTFNQYLPSGPSISPSYSKFISKNSNYAPSMKYKPAQPSRPVTDRSYIVSDSLYKHPNPSIQMTSSSYPNQMSSSHAPASSSCTYTSNTISSNPSFSSLSPFYGDT